MAATSGAIHPPCPGRFLDRTLATVDTSQPGANKIANRGKFTRPCGARLRNLTRSRYLYGRGEPSSLGTGERPLGSRPFRLQRQGAFALDPRRRTPRARGLRFGASPRCRAREGRGLCARAIPAFACTVGRSCNDGAALLRHRNGPGRGLSRRSPMETGLPGGQVEDARVAPSDVPAASFALILIALTAPVAPACRVSPSARRTTPSANRTLLDPRSRIPMRPIT